MRMNTLFVLPAMLESVLCETDMCVECCVQEFVLMQCMVHSGRAHIGVVEPPLLVENFECVVVAGFGQQTHWTSPFMWESFPICESVCGCIMCVANSLSSPFFHVEQSLWMQEQMPSVCKLERCSQSHCFMDFSPKSLNDDKT